LVTKHFFFVEQLQFRGRLVTKHFFFVEQLQFRGRLSQVGSGLR